MKKRLSNKSTMEVSLILGGTFLILAILGLIGFLFIQDATRWGMFPPLSKVSGVNVSGLSKADAVARCEAELKDVASKPVVMSLDGEKYSATPEQLGLRLDYTKMVDNAYKQAWSPSIFERMFRSFTNRPKTVNGLIAIQNDDALVTRFVASVTAQVNQAPKNAYVNVTSGSPVIVKARDGYQVAESVVRDEVGQALNSKSRTVEVLATKTPATLNDGIFKRLIVINLSQHMLYLYDRQALVVQYPIACGQEAYPTPVGQWEIVGKQMNPTWYNPHSAWSASMPETIGPGSSNPLGLRAMPLNASGVLIHGTSNDGSIGTSASHGCIRMHMANVISLFDQVQDGTPVYIIKGAGNPGFDVAATPSWRLKEETAKATPSYTGD